MTDKLEQKIQEIEEKFPGIAKKVKSYSGATWGMHWNAGITDIEYIETNNYQIAATRWNEHHWDEGGGGIKWTDWISVYYKPKQTDAEIKKIDTEKVVTRDQHHSYKDRTDLWGYNCVNVKDIKDDEIGVAWANKDGDAKLTYKIKLV